MMGNEIAERLARIQEKLDAACRRSGRKSEEVAIMAVTKFQPPEVVREAWESGVRLFGESRVQEAQSKFGAFREIISGGQAALLQASLGEAALHLVGSLQRNKAKTAAALFDCIQSLDRLELIDCLGGLTIGREKPLMVLLEYLTGEDSKSGFTCKDSLFLAAEKVLEFPGLKPAGLMTMAPFTDDAAVVRSAFRKLREAQEELVKRFPGEDWNCLSMGMTGDFEIAVEEGSTMIRIGTALFGEHQA